MTTTTDKDRLSEAFKQLRKHKFIAKQNYLCCQSCGWATIAEKHGEKATDVIFYHKQDSECSFKDGRLVCKMYLAHSFSSKSRGLLACAIFNQNGFYTLWDGTEDTRIAIVNMTPELEALKMLKTADRVCTKNGHEWGWQLQARELIAEAEKSIESR
jgi:Domain of unknown function (DUF6891)